jgi:hypothetical protein
MSLRKAIDAKCKECIYDPYSSGTWRKQVSECTSNNCPLYLFRPKPIKTSSRDRKAVIASNLGEKVQILGSLRNK